MGANLQNRQVAMQVIQKHFVEETFKTLQFLNSFKQRKFKEIQIRKI